MTPKVIRNTGVGEGVTDLDFREPGNNEQVAGDPFIDLGATETSEPHQLGELALEGRFFVVGVAQGDLATAAEGPFDNPADGKTPEIVRSIEIGNDGLHRGRRISGREGHCFEDRIEQRAQVCVFIGYSDAGHRPAFSCDRGDDREFDVLVVRVEVKEELVDLVNDLLDSGVGAVDLVNDYYGGETKGKRL